jgi:hypothetical protein
MSLGVNDLVAPGAHSELDMAKWLATPEVIRKSEGSAAYSCSQHSSSSTTLLQIAEHEVRTAVICLSSPLERSPARDASVTMTLQSQPRIMYPVLPHLPHI